MTYKPTSRNPADYRARACVHVSWALHYNSPSNRRKCRPRECWRLPNTVLPFSPQQAFLSTRWTRTIDSRPEWADWKFQPFFYFKYIYLYIIHDAYYIPGSDTVIPDDEGISFGTSWPMRIARLGSIMAGPSFATAFIASALHVSLHEAFSSMG